MLLKLYKYSIFKMVDKKFILVQLKSLDQVLHSSVTQLEINDYGLIWYPYNTKISGKKC